MLSQAGAHVREVMRRDATGTTSNDASAKVAERVRDLKRGVGDAARSARLAALHAGVRSTAVSARRVVRRQGAGRAAARSEPGRCRELGGVDESASRRRRRGNRAGDEGLAMGPNWNGRDQRRAWALRAADSRSLRHGSHTPCLTVADRTSCATRAASPRR
jgi:hypothetical protein